LDICRHEVSQGLGLKVALLDGPGQGSITGFELIREKAFLENYKTIELINS
jgi:hypothetical protein